MDAATLRRVLVRYRFVVFAVAAVVLVGSAWAFERSRGADDAPAGYLGPTPGPDADGHIAQKSAYLREAAGSDPDRAAAGLVSLSRLHTGAEADALASDYQVDVVFVSVAGFGQDVVVTDGAIADAVATHAAGLADIREAEAEALVQRADAASGDTREGLLVDAEAKMGSAADLRQGCACVYALVVEHSTLGGLLALQDQDAVTLVDVPDPPVAELSGWELTPILPDESP